MLRRNLLKSLATIIPASLLPMQKVNEKPFRTELNEFADGSWTKRTCNSNGSELTFETSSGYWSKSTYDQNGNQLSFQNSIGLWSKSMGHWGKCIYDQNGAN